jgi:seryl-tRNA synthetase
MLDISYIRENVDKVKEATVSKQLDSSLVDELLKLDLKRRALLKETEELRAERNIASKNKDIEKGKTVKENLQKLEPELVELEKKYKDILWQIPNIVSEDTLEGKDESGNKPVKKWGTPKKFDFEPKDHLNLGESLGIIDTETASKVSGARFGYLKGDLALMQFALLQFALGVLTDENVLKEIADKVEKGYSSKTFIPVIPPVFIKPEVFEKMARLNPKEERYYIPTDDIYLIGSAEHTLGPIHMDETLNEKDMPKRYVGYSTAFRREAGSYGKDTKGMIRVHQFDKLEIESFTTKEDSIKEQDFIIGIQEYLMQKLEIPYQVVSICTGDMGKPDFRQMDIECWMPGEGKYRETHTSDLMTDYQARRLNTKVRRLNGENEFAHMNDATVFAIGRTIITIMENYQNEDGSITIPKVLQKWMGKEKITL